MRIAFHPTLKAPDHPVPSGDREMARLLLAALQADGHQVTLPSSLRSHGKIPNAANLCALEATSAAEVERMLRHWQGKGAQEKPDIWFTYHLYYKAPDLIGPATARALNIPYVVAEASYAPKRNHDAWRPYQAHVEAALARAGVVFCLTQVDRQGLEMLPQPIAQLVDLPPFLDAARFGGALHSPRPPGKRLITIAMMRAGAKLRSYQFLAQALALMTRSDWHLTIVGDGPARAEVERAFAQFSQANITFAGVQPRKNMANLLAEADIFVWPGFEEAFGMVYLEAQASGLPVVALNQSGVASTMLPNATGLLVDPADPALYASAIARLWDNSELCLGMGEAARHFIQTERNLPQAAAILTHGLQLALAKHPQ